MEGTPEDQDVYEQTFVEKPDILDKYKAAGVICEAALDLAISLCVDGANATEVCGKVDDFMVEELAKVFSNKKSKKLERGIAFPCCLSVNELCGHVSPLADDTFNLKNEDLVKIEFGCHIDGYASGLAHSVVVGGKSTGR